MLIPLILFKILVTLSDSLKESKSIMRLSFFLLVYFFLFLTTFFGFGSLSILSGNPSCLVLAKSLRFFNPFLLPFFINECAIFISHSGQLSVFPFTQAYTQPISLRCDADFADILFLTF